MAEEIGFEPTVGREWVELGSCAPVNVSKELDGLFNAGYTRGQGYSVESGNVQEYKCCFHGRLGCEYSARARTHTDALNSESMCTIEELNEHHHDYSKQTTKLVMVSLVNMSQPSHAWALFRS